MELKVIVPTSLDEITLAQYQRFAKIEGDEEFLTKKMLEIFVMSQWRDYQAFDLKTFLRCLSAYLQ